MLSLKKGGARRTGLVLGLVPPTLRLPLVPDLLSTDMAFPDFNIIRTALK